jgi:ankyrin repeat protein
MTKWARLALWSALVTAPALFAQENGDARLVGAMQDRDLAAVRAALSEGVDVNVQDAATATALHWAAHWNELAAVELLLEAGADPNLANRFGVTPLHEAALVGNAEMLSLLLAAGGDPNAVFGEGESVLMTAARAGDSASVQALLDAGGDPNTAERWHGQTALMWAAIEGHADVAELLIAHGAELDQTSTEHDWPSVGFGAGAAPKTLDVGGLTALQFAARDGALGVAETLLEAGADANAAEPMYGLTALQLAVLNGHYTLAKRMIEFGVDLNDGSLYLAIDTRNLGYYPQRPNPPEKDGEFTQLDVIEALLAAGADPDLAYTKRIPERTVQSEIEVPQGATPLDRAAEAGDFEVIEALAGHGADPSVATADGTTPLMLLAGYSRAAFGGPPKVAGDARRLAVVRLLLEKGAAVDAVQSKTGNTALHYAAMRNAPDLVALLKEFGADDSIENAQGRTAEDLLTSS